MSEVRANVVVLDMDEELSIWSANELPISVGDDVSVTCGASAHKFATELNWYKNDLLIENTDSMYWHSNCICLITEKKL